jgi:hypothetical protein
MCRLKLRDGVILHAATSIVQGTGRATVVELYCDPTVISSQSRAIKEHCIIYAPLY